MDGLVGRHGAPQHHGGWCTKHDQRDGQQRDFAARQGFGDRRLGRVGGLKGGLERTQRRRVVQHDRPGSVGGAREGGRDVRVGRT